MVGPAIPVEIQGFESIPEAGDEFVIVKDEKVARRIAEDRRIKHRDRELVRESKVTLESFLASRAGEEPADRPRAGNGGSDHPDRAEAPEENR